MNAATPQDMGNSPSFVFGANPLARKIEWGLDGSTVTKNEKPFLDLAEVKAVEVFDFVPEPHVSFFRTLRMSISTTDGKTRTIECSWPPSQFPDQYGDFEVRVLVRLAELQPEVLIGKSTKSSFRGLNNLRYLGVAMLLLAALHLALLVIAPHLFDLRHAAVFWSIGMALLFAPRIGKRDAHLPASEYTQRFS